jgi:hypothetical protein
MTVPILTPRRAVSGTSGPSGSVPLPVFAPIADECGEFLGLSAAALHDPCVGREREARIGLAHLRHHERRSLAERAERRAQSRLA